MLGGVALSLCTQALIFLIAIGHSGGTATNRTIDDEFGDSVTGEKPIFLPTTTGIWAGEECTGCRVQPSRDRAFRGTWTAATYRNEEPGGSGPISFELSFKGTAIYVYFITGNQIAGGIITTLTECNFTLDGQHASFFRHVPDQTTILNYDVLAFSSENLQNVDHTLRASTEGVDYHVFVNFDYAIYTFDDGLESTIHPPTLVLPTTSSFSLFTSPIPSATIPKSSTTSPRSSSSISGNLTTNLASQSTTVLESPTPKPQISPTSSRSLNATLIPDNVDTKKVPLGAILGGAMGGLALVLVAMLLLYIYFDRRGKQRELRKASAVDFPPQYSPVLQREQLRDPRTFSLHKRVSSRPHSPADVSGNSDTETPHGSSSSNITDMAQYAFTKGRSNFGNTDMGITEVARSPGVTNTSAAVSNSDLRARQLDLERRLQDAQRGLRAIGIDSQGGPVHANAFLAMAHTHRRGQQGVEEPPPEYSAR